MNITYDYYKIFYYVAKYKSFTKAANILLNNQPNITRSMNKLESQLGCKLLIRSNKGITLTPEGEKLFSHVEIAFKQLHDAELELANDKTLQSGIVTIGASETALHGFLLQKLRTFHNKYPNIRIRITNHSTPEAVKALKNGIIDFAVVTSPSDVKHPLKEISLKYFKEILICSKKYNELSNGIYHLKELKKYPIICLGKGTKTYEFFSNIFLKYGLSFQPDIEVATTDLILPMVKNELGIGFIPENFIKNNNEIIKVNLAEKIPNRSISLIKDINKPLRIAARELEKLLYQ